MKLHILYITTLASVLLLSSCNQSSNTSQTEVQSDTINQVNDNTVDTTSLVNKIDIEEFKKLGYQIFEEDNFVIKTNHSFSLDNSFEGDGSTFPYKIYAAYKNKGDFENGIMFKIKIDNIEADYKNIERKDYSKNTKSFMDNYKKNLTDYNIDYSYSTVDKEEAILYQMNQQEPNTGNTIRQTAAFFVHERTSYYVQITSSKDQEKELKTILNNIKFIK
jgi:hypothetical protein